MNGSDSRPSLSGSTHTPNHVERDLERFNKAFERAGAVRTALDGFQWVDDTKVPPELMRAYRLTLQYGLANGLLP